jgi:N-acetylneuraminic acid mutarotase
VLKKNSKTTKSSKTTDMKKLFAIFLISILSSSLVFSQGFWTQKSTLGGNARSSGIGMATSTKGYVTCGFLGGVDHFKDMWEYNPVNNTWTQKSDFPGLKRRWLNGFTINDKVYVGLGVFMISAANYNYYTDLYEFDPTTNSWTSKANFPGSPRAAAFSFVIDGIGYIGGGVGVSGVLNDLWAYNPNTNSWTQKNNIGCGPRTACASFTIGDYGYIGTGDNGSSVMNDFWQYGPKTDSWTQKSQFPGTIRWYASGFSLGNYGYLGTGIQGSSGYDNFWQYDPNTNLWTPIASLTGGPRYQASSFTINNIAYIGTGFLSNSTYTNDLWAYTPSWYGVSEFSSNDNGCSIYPNPTVDKIFVSYSNQNSKISEINIYDINGKLILQKQVKSNQKEVSLDCTSLAKGKYFIRVTGNEKVMVKTIVKL